MKKTQKKTDEIHQFILENVEEHPAGITSIVSEKFGISRQASHRHVHRLVQEGLLIAHGATRDRTYEAKPLVEFSINLSIKGLQEDKVWREHIRTYLENLPKNILSICQYGFTEMVNNAIDHSEGRELDIFLRRTYKVIEMNLVDNGVGIFNKIQNELSLDDQLHAILELAKGKLTTDPDRHTGEGIFFTSRMFDEFSILSGKLYFKHFEPDNDWLLEDTEEVHQGTDILMKISTSSNRTTKEVFDRFTAEGDYGFSKTHVPVFLARYGDENLVSRSQAKRLLARFERFREIILDFNDVDSIGQAFADEIFRVFVSQHPNNYLYHINANEQVTAMIKRARHRN
jgi:anti-sigma regulatory factor (Ser/Thr protein kinase)